MTPPAKGTKRKAPAKKPSAKKKPPAKKGGARSRKKAPEKNVRTAVEADLKKMPAAFRNSALAATALAMAKEIDKADNSATSKSMCAGKLIDAMETLRELVPEAPTKSALDEIAKRRERRLARQAGT